MEIESSDNDSAFGVFDPPVKGSRAAASKGGGNRVKKSSYLDSSSNNSSNDDDDSTTQSGIVELSFAVSKEKRKSKPSAAFALTNQRRQRIKLETKRKIENSSFFKQQQPKMPTLKKKKDAVAPKKETDKKTDTKRKKEKAEDSLKSKAKSEGKPNLFSQFALKGSGNDDSGWMNTKKKGRDDSQIEKDRKFAEEVKREERRAKMKTRRPAKKKPTKNANKSKGAKKSKWSDDDDDDSVNSFIVSEEENDEDDGMSQVSLEDSEGNELDGSEEEFDDEEHESEDEDELELDDESDGSHHRKNDNFKKPAPPPKRATRERNTKSFRARGDSAPKFNDRSFKLSRQDEPLISLDSSSSEEENSRHLSSSVGKKYTSKANQDSTGTGAHLNKSKVKSKPIQTMSSDDDEEFLGNTRGKLQKTKNSAGLPTQKKSASSKVITLEESESSSNSEDDDSDDDASVLEERAVAKAMKESMKEEKRRRKRQQQRLEEDDSSPNKSQEEKDYEMAFQLSIEENQKEMEGDDPFHEDTTKSKPSRLKRLRKNDNGNSNAGKKKRRATTVVATSSPIDVENIDNPFDEEEEDESVKNILSKVNDLSHKVLTIMQSFCQILDTEREQGSSNANNDNDNATKKNVQSMNGMIVNGALAISSLKDGMAKKSEEDWLSAEEVAKCISPEVTLADYQLIGVNWMALMDRLECDIDFSGGSDRGRSKKKKGKKKGRSNVNGVLADEMGLGKTVQTIAFLAWLKFGKNKKGRKKKSLITSNEKTLNGSSSSPLVLNSDREDNDEESEEEEVQGKVPPLHGQESLPHLVVVPASVLDNWLREFDKVCPDLVVEKYHGNLNERASLRKSLRRRSRDPSLPDIDVILTTFSYFSNERSEDRDFLKQISFDYMVVDEAHSLRNAKGKRYIELDKMRTSHRLLLTGTPIQNNPSELLALICFLMRLFHSDEKNDGGTALLDQVVSMDLLNNGSNQNKKSKNTTKGETKNDKSGQELVYQKLKQLLAPFILRRRKGDVLAQAIPPKIRKDLFVPFNDNMKELYDSILEAHFSQKQGADALVDLTAGSNGNKFDMARSKHLFTSLRKAANHPLLLRTRHTSSKEVDELAGYLMNCGYFGNDSSLTKKLAIQELAKFSDFDIHCAVLEIITEMPSMEACLKKYTLVQDDLFCSPKLEKLRTFLPELISDGHRILIFSQWTRCLDLLGCFLDSIELRFLRLDGSTSIKDRQNLIDEFNNDEGIKVFLLSTRAGGMGINLTAADTCIIHDLDFNPFNDLQAEDRCHRIGQTKEVTVYKMITEDSVDADIHAMQQRKAEMTAAIFDKEKDNGGGEGSGTKTSAGKQISAEGKKSDKELENEGLPNILKATFDRYMQSPQKKRTKSVSDTTEIVIE